MVVSFEFSSGRVGMPISMMDCRHPMQFLILQCISVERSRSAVGAIPSSSQAQDQAADVVGGLVQKVFALLQEDSLLESSSVESSYYTALHAFWCLRNIMMIALLEEVGLFSPRAGNMSLADTEDKNSPVQIVKDLVKRLREEHLDGIFYFHGSLKLMRITVSIRLLNLMSKDHL